MTPDLAGDFDAAAVAADADILVNCAGLQHVAAVEEFPLEKFRLLLAVMLEAPFRLAQAALPHMYAEGFGRIVNISSVHGLRASPYKAAYVAAKHGLEGLSKVIALEGGPRGVTSNTVCPAYVRTPLVEKQIADQARIHGIPEESVITDIMLTEPAIKRLIEPDEVAELVAFLCSPPPPSPTAPRSSSTAAGPPASPAPAPARAYDHGRGGQTKADRPVMARPTISVLISRVPS
jgi:3-hydroxybutyrate dehydrogenase